MGHTLKATGLYLGAQEWFQPYRPQLWGHVVGSSAAKAENWARFLGPESRVGSHRVIRECVHEYVRESVCVCRGTAAPEQRCAQICTWLPTSIIP